MIHPENEYYPEGQAFHGSVPLVMGTRLDVLVCGATRKECESLWDTMCDKAARLESIMNRFDPDSEISRINKAGKAELSAEMAEILDLCEQFRKSTLGLFDIGRGGVDWNAAIKENRINLGGGDLDLGGFGKGFLLKKFQVMMQEAGITSAYIDFGGSSILGLGHHPYGDCWKVGVSDPFTGALTREIRLTDLSMSTSGNQPGYEGHITDPRNGKTIDGRKLVTVLSPDPLTAEIASTAAMIANDIELDFIRENNDIAEIFIHQ